MFIYFNLKLHGFDFLPSLFHSALTDERLHAVEGGSVGVSPQISSLKIEHQIKCIANFHLNLHSVLATSSAQGVCRDLPHKSIFIEMLATQCY
jgi:hypothetical protein